MHKKISLNEIRKMIRETLKEVGLERFVQNLPDSLPNIAKALKRGPVDAGISSEGILIYPNGVLEDLVITLRTDGTWSVSGITIESATLTAWEEEVEASKDMADEEYGPRNVKKMKDYEDGVHTGVASLVDVIGVKD